MAQYTVKNELSSLEFETSWLESFELSDSALTLTFREAIIAGNSQTYFHNCKPCSWNDGHDRYALPRLTLTFQNYKILSVLIEEKHIKNDDGVEEAVIPARVFSPDETSQFLRQLSSHPTAWIYYLGYYQDSPMIYMEFTPEFSPETHELWLTAEENIAKWEDFGDIAFYLPKK